MTSPAKDHAPTRAYYFKLKIMTRKRQNSQLACLIVRHTFRHTCPQLFGRCEPGRCCVLQFCGVAGSDESDDAIRPHTSQSGEKDGSLAPYSPPYRLALVKPDWTVEQYLVT